MPPQPPPCTPLLHSTSESLDKVEDNGKKGKTSQKEESDLSQLITSNEESQDSDTNEKDKDQGRHNKPTLPKEHNTKTLKQGDKTNKRVWNEVRRENNPKRNIRPSQCKKAVELTVNDSRQYNWRYDLVIHIEKQKTW